MSENGPADAEVPAALEPDHESEHPQECHSNSSH
jgi:hypothetical protein